MRRTFIPVAAALLATAAWLAPSVADAQGGVRGGGGAAIGGGGGGGRAAIGGGGFQRGHHHRHGHGGWWGPGVVAGTALGYGAYSYYDDPYYYGSEEDGCYVTWVRDWNYSNGYRKVYTCG